MNDEINKPKILDSGNRREFDTGAVRDIAEGKGRCDLLPLDVVASILRKKGSHRFDIGANILKDIDQFIRNGQYVFIYDTINEFNIANEWGTIQSILEVSKHYEEGAKKYEERNWEKGIPAHCFVDSGIRHLLKWCNEWADEPHDRAFLWNMYGLLWTIWNHEELNDLPYAKYKLFKTGEQLLKEDMNND